MKLYLLEEVYSIFWKTVLSWELHYKSLGEVFSVYTMNAYGGMEVQLNSF
jgi:hypothetical protein